MKNRNRIFLVLVFGIFFSISLKAQHRPIDAMTVKDRFGLTTMSYYTYRNWIEGSNSTKGSMRFDSFRVWAKSDVNKKFYGAVQYRLYEGWQTPAHMYVGMNIDEKNALQLGQTWVPFGFGYQPFDDWGNIAFYVGLQDDYDYGLTWRGIFGDFTFHAGFFKNQQLSSSSPFRYDTDVFSGDVSGDYLFSSAKKNQEVNQINLRAEFHPSGDNWEMQFGISGMGGDLYNQTTDRNGTRYATALHAGIDFGNFHYNAQGTWYKYTQALVDTATQDQKDFVNVSSWAFAYEIPASSSIFTTSAAFDIIGEKLTVHGNYSYLWGGTSQASSQLVTFGIRTIWDTFEIFAEAYYGENDPQLSGNSSGYGRNANSYDLRIDVRFFYKLKIVNDDILERLKRNSK
jgi:hypothetical protein